MRSRIGRVVVALLASATVFAAGRAMLSLAARRAGVNPWHPPAWARYDSYHYLGIAQDGFRFFPCPADSSYRATDACGNTGWLPGYPGAIAALGATGLDGVTAGVLVSAACHLAMLVLAWTLMTDVRLHPRLATLFLLGVAPGIVYHHAVFPLSLFSLCALGALGAAAQGRWRRCGWLAAGAGFSYSTGFLLGPVLAGAAWRSTRPDRGRGALYGGLGAIFGFGAALFTQWSFVGRGDAFFRVQEKYGHGLHGPWSPLHGAVSTLLTDGKDWPSWQTVVVAALATILVIALAAGRIKLAGLDGSLCLFGLVYWMFPLVVGGRLSFYRAEALLLPSLILARRVPVPIQWIAVAGLAYLEYKMGVRFFRRELV